MRHLIRPFLAILLALMLGLTGQSMAVARGATAATGQMVICTGTSTVTIYTDAEGNRTSAPHICPDCTAAAFVALVSGASAVARETRFSLQRWAADHAAPHIRYRSAHRHSRAPPFLI
ncbi:DUF2946 family protein [Roseobacter sp. S98]|uniref:DUF2946 family protein n=1 Tax=Roseobacter algicola (ex Choi et al. 2025) (nom. illeg.) TaxID=3092138 RepID=UPI003F51A049